MSDRIILRTDTPARHPWPEDTFLQGGTRGIVFSPDGNYRTAFVEAFPRSPNTFLRGEGGTVAEAEDACWAKYERMAACPAHPQHGPFEARQYTNGAGFCTLCGTWFSKVLPETPADPERRPSLMERAFTGESDALAEMFTAAANVDSLPERDGDRPMVPNVRAITVREPWASCIAAGIKLVENRGAGTNYRGTLFIHTSQQSDDAAARDRRVRMVLWPGITEAAEMYSLLNRLDTGVVIAVADLVDVHTAETVPTLIGPSGTCCRPWGERLHNGRPAKHLVLANVRRLAKPVPARGALGLWTPTADVVAQVERQLTKAGAR